MLGDPLWPILCTDTCISENLSKGKKQIAWGSLEEFVQDAMEEGKRIEKEQSINDLIKLAKY